MALGPGSELRSGRDDTLRLLDQTVAAKLTYKIRRGRVVNAALRVGEAFYPSHAVHPAL